jgi:hypothetical protein
MDPTMGAVTNHDAAPSALKTSWTIMLYIAADSALANFAVESLKQLNSSVRAASTEDKAEVVVAAQFSIDAPGGQEIQRYIFKKGSKEGLKNNKEHALNARGDLSLSEQGALERFLHWVYEGKDKEGNDVMKADHYALILWSHGPELFLQPPPGGKTGDSASLYLTPVDLRDALAKSQFCKEDRKLELVGFDACSMSMFEMAYEIQDLAKLMIASQEEVPDASFPYYELVKLFREQGDILGTFLGKLDSKESGSERDSHSEKEAANEAVTESLKLARPSLTKGVQDYLDAYQDYVVGKHTGMNPVTLSVLNLTHCGRLKEAVDQLACALLKGKDDRELMRCLIQARNNSQDYAGGLYVDLHEFCTKLEKQLDDPKDPEKWTGIRKACQDVVAKLTPQSDPLLGNSLILMNGAVTEKGTTSINENNTTNHGISIYLPYLSNRQFGDKVNRPLVKGGPGTNGAKGIPTTLNVAAAAYMVIALHHLILDAESYYEDLKLAKDTAWYGFITDQWTKAIADTDPDPGFHYSDRQIEINRRRKPFNIPGNCRKYGTS